MTILTFTHDINPNELYALTARAVIKTTPGAEPALLLTKDASWAITPGSGSIILTESQLNSLGNGTWYYDVFLTPPSGVEIKVASEIPFNVTDRVIPDILPSSTTGVLGEGAENQIAYWTTGGVLTGSSNISFDGTTTNIIDGLNVGNNQGFPNDKGLYLNGNGITGGAGTLRYNASNAFEMVNQAHGANDGAGFVFVIYTTAGTTPQLIWDETPGVPEQTRLALSRGGMGSTLLVGGNAGDIVLQTSGSDGGTDIVSLPGELNVAGPFVLDGVTLTLGVAGYTAMTGTVDRDTEYDTSSITLPQLAERVAALVEDLTDSGILAP